MAGRKPVPVPVGTQMSTMKKTLVLHPKDPTTDFLCDIYRDINATVVREFGPLDKEDIVSLIESHDRIIMLGHGTEDGLCDRIRGKWIIDRAYVGALKGKELVAIWCNANEFFEEYDLEGFTTGMFISEIGEAYDCAVKTTIEDIDASNEKFSNLVKLALRYNEDPRFFIDSNYRAPLNECVKFNRECMGMEN